MTNFEKVRLFMTTFGQEVKKKSGLSTDKINNLRINLILFLFISCLSFVIYWQVYNNNNFLF